MQRFLLTMMTLGLLSCSQEANSPTSDLKAQPSPMPQSQSADYDPLFKKLGEGAVINFPGHEVLHHIKVDDLPSEISLTEITLAPKMLGAPPHIHKDEDEIFIVMSGRVHFLNGENEIVVETGSVASLPRGNFHGFWNPYDEPVNMLMVIAPGHFEEFFADVERAVNMGGPKSPPEVGAIIAQQAAERNVTVDMSRLPKSALALLGPLPQ